MLVQNVRLFSVICKISQSLGSLLITWDSQKKCMVFNQKFQHTDKTGHVQSDQTKLTKYCYLHSFALLIVIAQCLIGNSSEVAIKAQEVIAITIMLCLTSHLHTSRIKAEELVLYINGHFQFAKTFGHFSETRKSTTFTERLSKIYAQIFVLTSVTFPTALLALHWMQPCTASLPGYWLLSECMTHGPNSENETNSKFWIIYIKIYLKLFVFAFSQWTWQFGVNASVFIIGGVVTLGTASLRSHLEK